MKKNVLKTVGALFTLLILMAAAFTISAYANSINTVEMWVDIHNDGSATIKEVWNITMTNSSNTEWYVAKHNLDQMEILDLIVNEVASDGSMIPFETLTTWNLNASREEKAGKCGLVETNGGYEVCWGFGELGRHEYIVTYTITDIVKSYQGGDAMSYNFLSDASGGADVLNIYLSADDFVMEYPETRVWVFGCEAESGFEDGGIAVMSQGRFSSNDYAAVLLAFEPGLLSPKDQRSETIDEIIELNMEGSIWDQKEGDQSSFMTPAYTFRVFGSTLPTLIFYVIFMGIILRPMLRRKSQATLSQKIPSASQIDYCRELPFMGNLGATYTRLYDIGKVEESAMIGCYLLKWIQTQQVDIITQPAGLLKQREDIAIRLRPPAPDMTDHELRLYKMVKESAGRDGILQNKEFEKWARKKYSTVSSWLSSCQRAGKAELKRMGVYTEVPVKRFLGLSNYTVTKVTPYGEEMTIRVFGFKRYLKDFTIINEREVREVELWNQYLIFAQLLGIADRVAEQFKQLYPNYFTQANAGGYSYADVYVAATVSRSFAQSMYKGYRAGRSASSGGSSSSGGGGSSSSGGGGGASSGGGGAGGR